MLREGEASPLLPLVAPLNTVHSTPPTPKGHTGPTGRLTAFNYRLFTICLLLTLFLLKVFALVGSRDVNGKVELLVKVGALKVHIQHV